MAKVTAGLYSTKVARFIADQVNLKKIKKIGGGPIHVQTNSRSPAQIMIYIPVLDDAGRQLENERGGWRDKVCVGLHFTRGKWKLTRAQSECGLQFPVEVNKSMTDDEALALVESIFAMV